MAREYQQDYEVAVNLGQRSLELLDMVGDQINPPNVEFHLGRSYAELGMIDEALDCLVSAATQFYHMGTRQYLGNSLAEIGKLVVLSGCYGDLILIDDIIIAGLDDAADEMGEALSALPEIEPTWAMEVLRKCFAVMALASYKLEPELLMTWALKLRQEIIEPAVYSGKVPREKNTQPGIIIRELDFIAGAAHISSSLRELDFLPNDGLRQLCFFCYEMICYGWDISPYQWLVVWLNLYFPSTSPVTEAQLQAAATRAFKDEQPFVII
jgi:tetratricopeptide (TPR) repeat protein